MTAFRASTTVEIEIEINAKTLADAQTIADSIVVTVGLSLSEPYENNQFRQLIPEVWISTEEQSPDWEIEEE